MEAKPPFRFRLPPQVQTKKDRFQNRGSRKHRQSPLHQRLTNLPENLPPLASDHNQHVSSDLPHFSEAMEANRNTGDTRARGNRHKGTIRSSTPQAAHKISDNLLSPPTVDGTASGNFQTPSGCSQVPSDFVCTRGRLLHRSSHHLEAVEKKPYFHPKSHKKEKARMRFVFFLLFLHAKVLLIWTSSP